MSKVKLGNDFSDEGAPDTKSPEDGAKDVTEQDDSTKENDNSTDSPDSEKSQDAETGEKSVETSEDGEKDDAEGDTSDDKTKKEPSKEQILQGLLDTEKELDKDIDPLDTAIVAAKQRISQKRGERREKRDLVKTIDTVVPDEDGEKVDLSDIDEATIDILERFTKAKGLVPKSELQRMTYQQLHKSSEEKFYTDHPEYLPDNDPGDVLYSALKQELSYYVQPSDPKLIPELFERAHRAVKDRFPDKFHAKVAVKSRDTDKDTAKVVRTKTQSLGGGAPSGDTKVQADKSSKKSLSDAQIRALEDGGWTAEEIKELTG